MAKKRVKKKPKTYKKSNSLNKEIEDVEAWIYERRRFFKKLGLLILLILILVIISNIYL